MNIQQPERRTFLTRELEPIAANFLDALSHQLKSRAELEELNDSRTFEQIASDVQAIRYSTGAQKATHGTRSDYLHWLTVRNLYLDPRGTLQTQRQVQLKLDEVYISLWAQHESTPGTADSRLLEKELADLEAVASALGSLMERAVVPELMHLLSDEKLDANVHASIAIAVVKLGNNPSYRN